MDVNILNIGDHHATECTDNTIEEQWANIDGPISRQVTVVIVGAGQRSKTYWEFAINFPKRMKVVAVADPLQHRRERVGVKFGLPNNLVVADWRELAAMDKMADCAVITTPDKLHMEPAIAFIKKGYHLLLEKPMSVSEEECDIMAKEFSGRDEIVAVCHVLRYHPPCLKIREIIESGELGDIVTINHTENIGFWHFAHSYVRGNWRNIKSSTFSLLAKCCHDIDLIMYWMGDRRCTKIQSFGGLYHFKESQKPEGAADRCFECPVEAGCPYSAQKIYLQGDCSHPRWPRSVVCDIEDHPQGYRAALTEALSTGPYGRCVYSCDNDVCDHQMVNMEFENGTTVSMTMNAFTPHTHRSTKICGTRGELNWDGSAEKGITVYDFVLKKQRIVDDDRIAPTTKRWGHDGADFFLTNAFTKAIANGDKSMVPIADTFRSHKLVFAAERSRVNCTIETVGL